MSQIRLNPRIAPTFRDRPAHERFLAAAVTAILVKLGGDELLTQTIDSVTDRGANFNRIVAGKPLLHWAGKTVQQIRDEGMDDGQIKEIRQAFIDEGATFPDIPEPERKIARVPVREPAPAGDPEGQLFAGKPLAHWSGKTRKQMLAENVPPEVAGKILAALSGEANAVTA